MPSAKVMMLSRDVQYWPQRLFMLSNHNSPARIGSSEDQRNSVSIEEITEQRVPVQTETRFMTLSLLPLTAKELGGGSEGIGLLRYVCRLQNAIKIRCTTKFKVL
jgi:hypothetical protein